jgi:hypothetical protein
VEHAVSDPPAPAGAPASARKKRGRETAGDMLRSLGVVLVLVVVMWFLAQPPDSDEQPLRVVDPSADLASFTADVPTAPVPEGLPESWRATSSTLSAQALRIGYVTPDAEYAEYAASTAPAQEHVDAIAGRRATELEPVDVDGQAWEQLRDRDGSLSLVRTFGEVTVVLGSSRASASLSELEELAGSLATG